MAGSQGPDVGVPVFVGGLNRTGTTLMSRIVGSHSGIAVPPSEFLFFGKSAATPVRDRLDFEHRLRHILSWPRVLQWQLDERLVLERSRQWPPNARSLYLLPLDAYRRRLSKRQIGEKSVLNEFRLGTFEEWFEDYRVVQMIRDPLATYASAGGSVSPGVRGAVNWSRLWTASARLGMSAVSRNPRRHRLVRYEDLTAHPRRTIRELAEFLAIDVEEEAMLTLAGFRVKENSNFAIADDAVYEGAIRTCDRIDRHATVNASERVAVATTCAETARALGYELTPGRPFRVKLDLAAEWSRTAFASRLRR